VPSEVELKLSRCAVRLRHGGCKNAELYFLDSDALRSRIPDHNSSSATERQMMRKERRNDTFVPGENVEEMKRLAKNGAGLSAYITRNVRFLYD